MTDTTLLTANRSVQGVLCRQFDCRSVVIKRFFLIVCCFFILPCLPILQLPAHGVIPTGRNYFPTRWLIFHDCSFMFCCSWLWWYCLRWSLDFLSIFIPHSTRGNAVKNILREGTRSHCHYPIYNRGMCRIRQQQGNLYSHRGFYLVSVGYSLSRVAIFYYDGDCEGGWSGWPDVRLFPKSLL